MSERELATVVSRQVVETNENVEKKSSKKGLTLYGQIVNYLEDCGDTIDEMAEKAGEYVAISVGEARTKKFEENSTFFDKFIKNNDLKIRSMEKKRSIEVELAGDCTQGIMKGGVYIAKKLLEKKEKSKINEYVWGICVEYANSIGLQEQDIRIQGRLEGIGRSLLHKRNFDYAGAIESYKKARYIDFEEFQAESIARILYTIYDAKHIWTYDDSIKEKDMMNLFQEWQVLGIYGNQAVKLCKKFENLKAVNAFEFQRTNQAVHDLWGNLAITIPHLDKKRVRQVNKELLQYVPNGDKQLVTRAGLKFATNVALHAGTALGGMNLSSSLLTGEAATTALSFFDGLDKESEIIGNCLEDSGIETEQIKKSMDAAKKRRQEIPAIIHQSKDSL